MTKVDKYLATVNRLEPDIHPIDAGAGWASVAISLKRLADIATEAHSEMIRATREVQEHHETAGHDDLLGRIVDALEKVVRVVAEPSPVFRMSEEAADSLRQQWSELSFDNPHLQRGVVDVADDASRLNVRRYLFQDGMSFDVAAEMMAEMRSRMAPDVREKFDALLYSERVKAWDADGEHWVTVQVPLPHLERQGSIRIPRVVRDAISTLLLLSYAAVEHGIAKWHMPGVSLPFATSAIQVVQKMLLTTNLRGHQAPEFGEVPGASNGGLADEFMSIADAVAAESSAFNAARTSDVFAGNVDALSTRTDVDWAATAHQREQQQPISDDAERWADDADPSVLTVDEMLALSRVLGVANSTNPTTAGSHQLGRDSEALLDVLSRNGILAVRARELDPAGRDDAGVSMIPAADPRVLTYDELHALRVVQQLGAFVCMFGVVDPTGVKTTVDHVAKGAVEATRLLHGVLVRANMFLPSAYPPPALEPIPTPEVATLDPSNVLSDDAMDVLRDFISAVHDLPGVGPLVYAHMRGAGRDDPETDIETFLGRW